MVFYVRRRNEKSLRSLCRAIAPFCLQGLGLLLGCEDRRDFMLLLRAERIKKIYGGRRKECAEG